MSDTKETLLTFCMDDIAPTTVRENALVIGIVAINGVPRAERTYIRTSV